jgi:predicted metal-binding membrane protein
MIVLFSVGVMNLAWMAVLTAAVAAEKILPGGHGVALAAGVAFVAFGGWLLLGGALPGFASAR